MRWVAMLVICLAVASSARAEDWGVRRDPFDLGTINRLKAILARDPYDEGALRQLVGMYRSHRTIAKLDGEYRAKGEDWAALVVLARLPASDASVLWKRVVVLQPEDARAWLAIGDTEKTDARAATAAYEHAVQFAPNPKVKKLALTKLVAAAWEPAMVDRAYGELIAMSPADGKLWLDRGNAQLLAKQYASAKESFAQAEQLSRVDPERKLTAMTSQGIALEGLGQADQAIAQYERTLDASPRGYYLAQEIVLRIVDAERKRDRLDSVIVRLEKRWPEKARGYIEWVLLGDLYAERFRERDAIGAYKRAVKIAPTEVATQRKLIALLDKLEPEHALAQHEAAAKVAPGDGPLQIELAKRYHPEQPEKAIATLGALAKRMSTNVTVRGQIAELYEAWERPLLAIGEYEAIAKLEPAEASHAILLGEAYWRVDKHDEARAAWNRLDKIATAEALFKHGDVLALHDVWDEAAEAYTKSLAKNAASSDTLYGRARAYESLARFDDAADDASRAVALTGGASLDDGLRNRNLLVRVLGKRYEAGDKAVLGAALARWEFAFAHGDVGAGYLLAAHHSRLRGPEHHEVLVALYRRAPTDDALGMAVARSYMHRHEFANARRELERIEKRSPARQKDIASLNEQVDEERERYERDIRLKEEGGGESDPDIIGRKHRTGIRFDVGTDVAKASGALAGFGFYRTNRVAKATAWTWHVDFLRRDDDMLEHRSIGIGVGLIRRLVDARRFEVAAGAGPWIELRYGEDIPNANFQRGALGGDLSLELLPRALPAKIGARFHQSLTDDTRSSALLLELGFELR